VEIVSDILGRRDLSDEMASLLLQKARGNPLFLQEMAFSLAGTETLDRLVSTSGPELVRLMAALEIPDRIQGLLMTRIDALPAGAKSVLRTAAVIGATFEKATLAGVLSEAQGTDGLDAEMDVLLTQALAEPEPSAPIPTFRFRHALIQEVAYDSLMFSKRRRLHVCIAEHLEGANAADLEPCYEALVHHYSAAQVDGKTRLYAVKAAGKARKLFAHDEAVAYYHQAMETIRARTPEAAALRSFIQEGIGDTLEVAGRASEAARAFHSSLQRWLRAHTHTGCDHSVLLEIADLAEDFAADAREAALSHKIGFAYGRTYSDYDLALKWLGRASETLPRGHPGLRAKIAVAESHSWFRKGEYRRAIDRGRLGLDIARRTGNRDVQAYASTILANSYFELGELHLAIRGDARALRLYEELDDLAGQAMAQSNLGASLNWLGRMGESLEHCLVALDMYSRIGNAREVAKVNANIGEIYVIRGDFGLAVEHLSSVIEECGRLPSMLLIEGTACLTLARAYVGLACHEQAEVVLRRSLSLLEKACTPAMLAEAQLMRAELELDMGEPDAQHTCQQALEAAQELGHQSLASRASCVLGRVAQAQGDRTQAERLIRDSVSQAERIDAPYERGLALLALAELYATWSDPGERRMQFRRTVRQAIRVLESVGARAAAEKARALAASHARAT
jgi:tetratricopeptide (TPR) repeat protein